MRTKEQIREYKKRWDKEHTGYNSTPEAKIRVNKYINSEKGRLTRKAYTNTIKGRYSTTKSHAAIRGIEFLITIDEFSKYWGKPCNYCGKEIKTIGLDRIDSNKGYIEGNLVPCCPTCNTAKLRMSFSDYINHCHLVAQKHPISND